MAGGLGMLLGLGLGAAKGYAGQKIQQKQQSEAAWHDFMTNAIHDHPEIADTQEGQKAIKGLYGENAPLVQGFLHTAAQVKQRSQQGYEQNVFGQGAQQQQGADPARLIRAVDGREQLSQQQHPQEMTTSQHFYDLADHAEQWLGSSDAQSLPKEKYELAVRHIAELRARGKQMESEAERAKYESPEAQKTASEARSQGKIDTEHANIGTITADAAKKSAAEASAGTAAREAVQLSPETTAKKVTQQNALETAKQQIAQKVGKPWTAKDALQARNAASNDAKRELTSSTLFGMKTTAPKSEDVKALTDKKMLNLGLLPSGQRMSDVGARLGTHQGRDGYYIPNPDGKTAKFYAIGS